MAKHLPDCMMPDGADPCLGFAELVADKTRLRNRVEELEEAIKPGIEFLDRCYGRYYFDRETAAALAEFSVHARAVLVQKPQKGHQP